MNPACDAAVLSATANLLGILGLAVLGNSPRDDPNLLFRGLNAQDVSTLSAGAGIIAKDPLADFSIAEHQSGLFDTQYISTSRSLAVAEKFGKGFGTVTLDRRKIPQPGVETATSGDPGVNKSLARQEQEVLFRGSIPQTAVVGYTPSGSDSARIANNPRFQGIFRGEGTRIPKKEEFDDERN